MAKTCKHPACGSPVFSKGLCKYHWIREHGTPIKPISDKRLVQIVEYNIKREKFLKDNKVCQIKYDSGCAKVACDIHHTQGKENELLLDDTLWKSACRYCHTKITENSAEAIEKGHSVSRHKKSQP